MLFLRKIFGQVLKAIYICVSITQIKAMNEKTYTYRYPHPAVTTDSVVFGFDGKALHLLLIERGLEPYKGCWALPGGFLKMDETVEEGAKRELAEETNVKDIYLEQFHVFSAVNRDPRERVITVAFLALIRESDYRLMAGDDAARAMWFEVDELPALAFDHYDIITLAREKLKEMLRTKPVIFHLLDKKFTMTELQRLYEAINETQYDRRNFSRKMIATGMLQGWGVNEPKTAGRPAELFSFDEEAFEENSKKSSTHRNPFDI